MPMRHHGQKSVEFVDGSRYENVHENLSRRIQPRRFQCMSGSIFYDHNPDEGIGCRCHFGTATLSAESMLLFSGRDERGVDHDDVLRFSCKTGKMVATVTTGFSPSARHGFAVAVDRSEEQHRVCIVVTRGSSLM
jgi:hypothetical protein